MADGILCSSQGALQARGLRLGLAGARSLRLAGGGGIVVEYRGSS